MVLASAGGVGLLLLALGTFAVVIAVTWRLARGRGRDGTVAARAVAFDSAREPLFLVDREDRIVTANRAAEERVKRPIAELRGERLATALSLRPAEEMVRTALPDGSSLTAVYDLSVQHDHLREQARALSSIEHSALERNDFIARMSHEIRTPLFGVVGVLELLDDERDPQKQRELLALVRRSSESLLALVNDILDLSKLDRERMELELVEFDANALVIDVAALFSSRAQRKGVAVVTELPPEATIVRGDPLRLRQVLTNLTSNAVKFTERGQVVLRFSLDGDHARFAVTDTGPGIDTQTQARLFHSFTQASAAVARQHGGTGLGLAIAHRLTRLMGGEIRLESRRGEGATFEVALPLPRATTQPRVEMPLPTLPSDTRPLRTLVVDDHPVNRLVTASLLEREGCVVELVESGAACLRRCNEEAFDLVIVDLRMPEMDGETVVKTLRARGYRARLVIATAELVTQKLRDGSAADEWLPKPFARAELLGVLARAGISPDVSVDDAAARLAVAAALKSEAREAFVKTSAAELRAMRKAHRIGDHATVRDIAHGLAGAAGMVGAVEVEQLARKLASPEVMPFTVLDELARALKAEPQ